MKINDQMAGQIADAMTLSFLENLPLDLKNKLLKGEIKDLKFEPVSNAKEPSLKCIGGEINFTFPLKPKLLKRIEAEKQKIVKTIQEQRKGTQDPPI